MIVWLSMSTIPFSERLLMARGASTLSAGGAARCTGKRFFSAGSTEDRKLLFYLFRITFWTSDFLICEDELFKVFATTATFVFKNRHFIFLYGFTIDRFLFLL